MATSSIDILLERAKGREFIIDMKTKFSIDRDIYFNSYKDESRLQRSILEGNHQKKLLDGKQQN